MFLVMLVILSILLQGLVGFSLTVTVVVVAAFWYEGREILWVGFVLGLVADAVGMRHVGLSSVLLMSVGLLVYGLRVQLEWHRVLFVAGIAVLLEVVWQMWWGERVYWYELLAQAGSVWLIWGIRQVTARRDAVYLRG